MIRIIDAQSAEIERLTGQRQAVRLTDDQIIEIGNEVHRKGIGNCRVRGKRDGVSNV